MTMVCELLLLEMRRDCIMGALLKYFGSSEHGTRLVYKGRSFGEIFRHKFWLWGFFFFFAVIFLSYLLLFGLNAHFRAKLEGSGSSISISVQQEVFPSDVVGRPPRSKHRKQWPLGCCYGCLSRVK